AVAHVAALRLLARVAERHVAGAEVEVGRPRADPDQRWRPSGDRVAGRAVAREEPGALGHVRAGHGRERQGARDPGDSGSEPQTLGKRAPEAGRAGLSGSEPQSHDPWHGGWARMPAPLSTTAPRNRTLPTIAATAKK